MERTRCRCGPLGAARRGAAQNSIVISRGMYRVSRCGGRELSREERLYHQRCLLEGGLRKQRVVTTGAQGGGGRAEPELAMLRFSIGLPELEENLKLPRAIGIAAAVLIVANIISDVNSAYTLRSTGVGLALAAACCALPWLDDRINGRNDGAANAGGTKQLAMVMCPDAIKRVSGEVASGRDDGISEVEIETELAWATYALMRNTPVTTFLLFSDNGGADGPTSGIIFRGEPGAVGLQLLEIEKENFLMRASLLAARFLNSKRADRSIEEGEGTSEAPGLRATSSSERMKPMELERIDTDGLLPKRVVDAVVIRCRFGEGSRPDRRICALLLSSNEIMDDRGIEWSQSVVEKMAEALAAA